MHEQIARATASVTLLTVGAVLLYFVGFNEEPLTLHNFAHDSRHAFAFPCH